MARSKPWKPTPVPTPAPTPTPTSCTDDDGTFQALETNPGGYTCAQVKQAGALDCSTAAVLCCTSCSGSAGSGNSAPTPTPVPTPAPTKAPTKVTAPTPAPGTIIVNGQVAWAGLPAGFSAQIPEAAVRSAVADQLGVAVGDVVDLAIEEVADAGGRALRQREQL